MDKSSTVLAAHPRVLVEISAGEFWDRHTILRIKIRKWYEDREQPDRMRTVEDYARLNQLRCELNGLEDAASWLLWQGDNSVAVANLVHTLENVNTQLWDVEDELRQYEAHACGDQQVRRVEFPVQFVELARSVYKLNDQRHLIKNELTRMLGGSPEVKMLPEYKELTDARQRLDESLGRHAGCDGGSQGAVARG